MTGAGLSVSRIDQLFLLARTEGRAEPADAAAWVWDLLASQGQGMIRDGKTLATAKDNLAELQAQAASFNAVRLPVLQALGAA